QMFPGHYAELDPTDQVWTPKGELISATASIKGVDLWASTSPGHRNPFYQTGTEYRKARGVWSSDGRYLYYGGTGGVFVQDSLTGTTQKLFGGSEDDEYFKLRISANGKVLGYFHKTGKNDFMAEIYQQCSIRA